MLTPESMITIGVLLLALVTVESGGWFLTRIQRGKMQTNELQKSFFRAGHAHAGVLLILSIVILTVIDQTNLHGIWLNLARIAVPAAALLMPAGFFFSVMGRNPQQPNHGIWLLWLGAACLTAGLITVGIALIMAA